ncbi:hypothetical protein F8566_21625 [Actinomadura rudentiformis]|uniref:histidine kinase n=2 Tax=Actinomadura rudentiformis TaxID=359158 RepID=A0A6H9YKZ8_9ACTN|nr:hypothetical protein F8566_21625 [Actinomadura rudentiformis]
MRQLLGVLRTGTDYGFPQTPDPHTHDPDPRQFEQAHLAQHPPPSQMNKAGTRQPHDTQLVHEPQAQDGPTQRLHDERSDHLRAADSRDGSDAAPGRDFEVSASQEGRAPTRRPHEARVDKAGAASPGRSDVVTSAYETDATQPHHSHEAMRGGRPDVQHGEKSARSTPFQVGHPGAPNLWQDVPLAPAPGLAALPALVDRAAMAGVRVVLDLQAVALPEGVAVSAYRIVQEALTNVVKHAAPARCQVSVWADEHEVRITVTDDGPGTRVLPRGPGPGEGHGLIGMRERVMMYGGDFSAGPRPEGGFGVSARLPYNPTEK